MYYAGIDAHLNYVHIAVLDRFGVMALESRISTTEPERLLEALAPFRPLEVVVETCPFWPSIHDLLVPAGIGFHLAHAKELRSIATAPQKNDAVDAELLARMLLPGLIPEAYPRPAHQRELLRLLRHRVALVRQRTGLAGRIHSQLHQQRLSLPPEKLLRAEAREWLQEIAWPRLTEEQRALVTTHFELIDQLTPLIRVLDRRIESTAAALPAAQLLATIPGVGWRSRHQPVARGPGSYARSTQCRKDPKDDPPMPRCRNLSTRDRSTAESPHAAQRCEKTLAIAQRLLAHRNSNTITPDWRIRKFLKTSEKIQHAASKFCLGGRA